MSSINPVSRSMNGIKTIETASLIFTDDNSSLNTSAGIVSAQANSTTALNGKINSVGFNTTDGVLTLTKEDGSTLTKNLDGRYLASLDEGDIPNLPASKITSGSFATDRIPNLNADKITTGTLGTDRIPELDADKITTGTLDAGRIPNLNASKINAGTIDADRIPDLPYVSVGTEQAHTDETIFGVKTFNEFPKIKLDGNDNTPDPTANNQLATKKYVDDNAGGSGDAVLNGGDTTTPQEFTGVNKFSNETEFEDILVKKTTNQNVNFNMNSQVGNIFVQYSSYTNTQSGGTTNIFYQLGGIANQISQGTTPLGNEILQNGSNSVFKSDGKMSVGGSQPTLPSDIVLKSRGGLYIDGNAGIRIPRRNLYDSPGLREWEINQNIGSGAGTSALNFLYSSNVGSGGAGVFYTRARLQSNGRLELDANLLQNQNFSDDRLKTNEAYLENATESLLKLSVQTYDKEKVNNFNLLERTGKKIRETGLIAQEVYYNAPEFRGLIDCGTEYNDEFDLSGNQIGDGNAEGTKIIPDEMDLSGVPIGEDPDYEGAGWSKTATASVEYQGFIAYLIKSNQELHERILKLEAKIM